MSRERGEEWKGVGNFVCHKGISLYRREYCINNKFSDIKCDYIYIKGDFFSCFEKNIRNQSDRRKKT